MRAAIVTGVSRGLGEALVAELLSKGWHVVGLARTPPERAAHAAYRFVRCDLGETATLADVARPAFEAIAAGRPVEVCLINNAATIAGVGVLGALTPADIATSLAVNLVAPAVLSNLFCAVFDDDASSGGSSTSRPAPRSRRCRANRFTASPRRGSRC